MLVKEEEIEGRKERIKADVRRRNNKMQEMDARRQLKPRREDAQREGGPAGRRREVRNASKNIKGYWRGLKRNWWNERVHESENACAKGRELICTSV